MLIWFRLWHHSAEDTGFTGNPLHPTHDSGLRRRRRMHSEESQRHQIAWTCQGRDSASCSTLLQTWWNKSVAFFLLILLAFGHKQVVVYANVCLLYCKMGSPILMWKENIFIYTYSVYIYLYISVVWACYMKGWKPYNEKHEGGLM